MKKTKILSLLTLSLALGVSIFSSLVSSNSLKESKASNEQVETTLGPGYVNPISGEYDPENPTKDNYSLAYRAGWLMMFPDNPMYAGVAYKTELTASNLTNTDLTLVKIYYDKDNYFTLKDVVDKGYSTTCINQFNDLVLNVSFNVKALKGDDFNAYNIYKVTIEKGFIYPYATAGQQIDYVQKSTYTLRNINYNVTSVADIVYSGGWEPIKTLDGGEESHLVAVGARSELQYRVHIRDGGIPDGSKAQEDENSGNCWLILHFPTGTYNPEAPSPTYISDTYMGYYNFLDHIHLTLTDGSKTIDMREIVENNGFKLAYNLWGEKNSIAFFIGTGNPSDPTNYHGKSFSKITIDAGAEFPSFQSTHGTTTKCIKYVQSCTINLLRDGGKAAWALNWVHGFSYGDTNITEVKAFKDSITYKGETLTKTYISLKLDNCNYQNTAHEVTAYSDYLLRNIFVNGKSLHEINKGNKTYIFINLIENDTISFSIEDMPNASDIKEIIVKGKTEIPAFAFDYSSAQAYGSVGYYGTTISVSYSREGSSFVKDNKITWTLWFDEIGEKVINMDYYNFDQAPKGVSNDRQQFLYWVDGDGRKLEGYLRIITGEVFYGRYLYFYYLTINVDGKTSTVKVDNKTRIADALENPSPTKNGYIFKGWVNENGEDVNIDNLVSFDQTVKANFVKDITQKEETFPTGIVIGSAGGAILLAALLTGSIIYSRSRRKSKKED